MERPTGQMRAERLLRELLRLHDVLHVLWRTRPEVGGVVPEGETLSSRQAQALYLIQPKPTTMTELAALMRLSPGATTPIADRLVELGMADRIREPADRRLVFLASTKRGRDFVREGNVWAQGGLSVLASVLEQEAPGLEEQCAVDLVRMVEAAVDALPAKPKSRAGSTSPDPAPHGTTSRGSGHDA
ncbi:MAG: MarR family transcriptional regulator [Candidatus Dormiibacterota bacterium]